MKVAATIVVALFFAPGLAAQEPDSTKARIEPQPPKASSSKWQRDARRDTSGLKLDIPASVEKGVEAAVLPGDTTVAAENAARRTGYFKRTYPNPRLAALMSFVVPGSGQAYNRKFWKIPLAWAACGATLYFTISNTRERNFWQRNYKAAVDGNPNTVVDSGYESLTPATLKQARDYYQKNMEISYLATAGAYLIVATDAFVDAHLKTFDVGDDLGLKIAPRAIPSPGTGGPTFGVGLCFSVK